MYVHRVIKNFQKLAYPQIFLYISIYLIGIIQLKEYKAGNLHKKVDFQLVSLVGFFTSTIHK